MLIQSCGENRNRHFSTSESPARHVAEEIAARGAAPRHLQMRLVLDLENRNGERFMPIAVRLTKALLASNATAPPAQEHWSEGGTLQFPRLLPRFDNIIFVDRGLRRNLSQDKPTQLTVRIVTDVRGRLEVVSFFLPNEKHFSTAIATADLVDRSWVAFRTAMHTFPTRQEFEFPVLPKPTAKTRESPRHDVVPRR